MRRGFALLTYMEGCNFFCVRLEAAEVERGRGHRERKIGKLAMLVGMPALLGRFVGLVLELVRVAGAKACVGKDDQASWCKEGPLVWSYATFVQWSGADLVRGKGVGDGLSEHCRTGR